MCYYCCCIFVADKPGSEQEEKRGAYRAMSACPTFSIRLETTEPEAKKAIDDFPFPVDAEHLPGNKREYVISASP